SVSSSAAATGASRPACRAGYITPPFPSPPITAARRKMARATWTSPTGVRTTSAPHSRAASSTTRLVERLQTTTRPIPLPASRTPHRVEGHRELLLPDPLDIDRRQLEYGVEVPLHRPLIRRNLPRPPSSSPVLPHQLQHPRAIRSVQEDPVRADELQGIPLYWVVTGRDRDPAAGRVVLDRQLHRGGRNQTDFHNGAPHGTQP